MTLNPYRALTGLGFDCRFEPGAPRCSTPGYVLRTFSAFHKGYTLQNNPQMIGGGDVLLFTDEKYNISNLVLKKLGIDLPREAAAPAKMN